MYSFGLLVVGGVMFNTATKKERMAQQAVQARELTAPPRSFVSPDMMHQLRALQDFTAEPPEGAIAATIGHLESLKGTESRQAIEWVMLDVDQALAHPGEFRGGFVKARGFLSGIETLTIRQPGIPNPEGITYRGWLYVPRTAGGGEGTITWQTAVRPPEGIDKEVLVEVEGVFLQGIEYEAGTDEKTILRRGPFLVVDSMRVVQPSEAKGFVETNFVLILVSLIILVLILSLFLFRKSRRPAATSPFTVRPPGPGR